MPSIAKFSAMILAMGFVACDGALPEKTYTSKLSSGNQTNESDDSGASNGADSDGLGIFGGQASSETSALYLSTALLTTEIKPEGLPGYREGCTGVLVNETTLLTAAHCVIRSDSDKPTWEPAIAENWKRYVNVPAHRDRVFQSRQACKQYLRRIF